MSQPGVVAGTAADPAVILPAAPEHSKNNDDDDNNQNNNTTDTHRDTIIKKYGLEDIVPRGSDFDVARANLMPIDGSTPIFAGGRPINSRRRESSSPAVVEALNRGFKLAHYPARALLPDDMFSGVAGKAKTSKVSHHNSNDGGYSTSPEPNVPGGASRGHSKASSNLHRTPPPTSRSSDSARYHSGGHARGNDPHDHRIPGDISPHVLPQALMMKKIAPARVLLESEVPLHENPRYAEQQRAHHAQMQLASYTYGDPEYITNLARHFRRCFPRTEKDDLHDDLPTSQFSGNFILRRYGGNFPEHCHYNFYRKYSEFGLGAATSEFHNFPAGRHPLSPV